MDTLCAPKAVDTSLELFGKKFKYPFFAGPVGAVNLHYSDSYDDVSYNKVLVSSCAENGIVALQVTVRIRRGWKRQQMRSHWPTAWVFQQ